MSRVVRLLTPENKINAATQLISSVFRQFLRFWTFQSQLSRDYLSVLVWTRLIATATDWEFVVWITTINQQPTANGNISLNKIGSRLTMVIIEPSRLVWIRLRSDSTQLDKTDIAQKSELQTHANTGRAQFSWDGSDRWRIQSFTPNAMTQQNSSAEWRRIFWWERALIK